MRGKIFLAVLPLLILVAIPFILRPRRIGQDNSGIPERIVIITAHNESIRYEYEQAFAKYCREKFGKEIALDFRSPGGTSDIVRYIADRFEAAKYPTRPASIAPIDAALIAKAYAKVREVLSTTEKTFSELCREVAPLFPKADCKPTAALTYQVLYALKRENALVITEKRVSGAREDLDAPKLYMSI